MIQKKANGKLRLTKYKRCKMQCVVPHKSWWKSLELWNNYAHNRSVDMTLSQNAYFLLLIWPIHAELPTPTPGFKLHSQQKSKTQENWNKAHAIKWSVSKTMNKTCNSLPIQCTSKSRHSPFHFSLLQLIASSPNTHSPFISPFNPRKFHTLFHLTKAWTWKPRRMVVSLVIKAFTEHMEKNGQKTIAMKSVFCCLLICYCTRVP